MASFTLWGVIASPYQLKMQSLLDYAQHSWQRWPDQAPWWGAVKMLLALQKAKKSRLVDRYPKMDRHLDEYPSVPFYSEDRKQFYYDSTGLAYHLDDHPECHEAPLLPTDPQQRFLCQFIDEAFDEFGLYMVHHNRWITSAATNQMGVMTGREMGKLLPLVGPGIVARNMPPRQVRRCLYLFSVAPDGFDAGVNEALTPPARQGFPATHALLDDAWRQYLQAMESLLLHQPYLLGDRFTLADASAYGQLSMNLVDGRAAQLLESLAPTTFAWLCGIRDGAHIGSRGLLRVSPQLAPLISIISNTFVPLMQQNSQAYKAARESGETRFNEAAFDQNRALYDGELCGHPFRSAVKTFQVSIWRDLCAQWSSLPDDLQKELIVHYPEFESAFV